MILICYLDPTGLDSGQWKGEVSIQDASNGSFLTYYVTLARTIRDLDCLAFSTQIIDGTSGCPWTSLVFLPKWKTVHVWPRGHNGCLALDSWSKTGPIFELTNRNKLHAGRQPTLHLSQLNSLPVLLLQQNDMHLSFIWCTNALYWTIWMVSQSSQVRWQRTKKNVQLDPAKEQKMAGKMRKREVRVQIGVNGLIQVLRYSYVSLAESYTGHPPEEKQVGQIQLLSASAGFDPVHRPPPSPPIPSLPGLCLVVQWVKGCVITFTVDSPKTTIIQTKF